MKIEDAEALLNEAGNIAEQWIKTEPGQRRDDLVYGYRAGYCYARNHSSPAPSGWIKCSDRLPAPHERVLAIGNGTPFVGAITCEGWKDVHTQLLRDPKHWMPLPAPPEPEKSEVEKAAERYVESMALSPDRSNARRDFMAGWEARKL